MLTNQHILNTLNRTFPLARAESWDKVGLQIGEGGAPVDSVYVAYDVTDQVLQEAGGCQCVVAYHPLLFRPLENLNFSTSVARLAGTLLARGQSLIVLHTALDAAAVPGALGDALARDLNLQETRVLPPHHVPELVKITTFVPAEAHERVCEAMWQAGAGGIGLYEEASFSVPGQGTFKPMPGAQPHLGAVGRREVAEELRVEMIAPLEKWPAVVRAMKAAHPYEEVAHDVLLMQNGDTAAAYGPARIGVVSEQPLEDYCRMVVESLSCGQARLVRAHDRKITRVACSPGSGASLIEAAARAGADLLVTGDIKHHDALKARSLGLCVLDVTHACTELSAVPLMASVLETIEGLRVVRSRLDPNPFAPLP